MICIIDYGVGSLFSLKSSLAHLGLEAKVSADAADIRAADRLILPGVGAFGDAMAKLEATGLVPVIREEAAKKPLLGICLGMQMMNTYFLVAEEAQRRGWSGTLLALFDQMKKERYMFTEPVDGHWNGHITRDSVDSFKHSIRVESGSRIEHLLGGPEILGASMHNYRITHPAAALRVTGRTADGTIEALEYGNQMLGVQFHPEADATSDALFQMICR